MLEKLSQYYFKLGTKMALNNHISDAIKILEKAILFDSKNWKALNVLGLCYYKIGEFDSAKDMWDKSIVLNTQVNDAVYYLEHLKESSIKNICENYNTALELAHNGKYKKAIKVLYRIPYKEVVSFANILGLCLYATRRRKRAIKIWNNALDIDKDNQSAITYLRQSNKEISKAFSLVNWIKR